MATPFLFEKDMTLRRLRQREGWPPPFLLFFLRGMVRWPSPFFLFFFRGWGDGRPPSSLVKEERTRGMATSILTILPEGEGKMTASIVLIML